MQQKRLSVLKHHAMKAYVVAEVKLHTF